MATLTHPVAQSMDRHRHPATTAMLVVLFWVAAAVLAATAHLELAPRSPAAGSVAAIAGVSGAGYCYMRFCARSSGVSHALGVGIVWLTLAVVTEIAVTMRLGRGWSALLGAPERPLLRSLFLFLWIFAPAVFARREEEA